MKTGEIWLAQFDTAVGSEIQKTRPCVVVSPDDMNAHLRTVIVAPMITGSRPAGFRVALTFQGTQGLIVLDQIQTLDRVCLVKHLYAKFEIANRAQAFSDSNPRQYSLTPRS
jgi:mRNA interferase MazF